MTTKTFFDKGIYKSTLKRFYLGSVLYFILSFLVSGMWLLLAYEEPTVNGVTYYGLSAYIINNFCEILAFAVPTVVALLVYRFVHSKKMGIFVHSLPVTRRANFVSTAAGAFTLMAIPVIANTFILMIISTCGYSGCFGIVDCIKMALVNLLILFVMFSISTFSAMCTGNSFAVVVINGVILFSPMVFASCAETFMLKFLYGYSYSGRALLSFSEEINPIFVLDNIARYCLDDSEIELAGFSVICVVSAVILYGLSFLMYKKRRCETCEEVAGFKALNPIFKYFVTFAVTLVVFSIFSVFLGEKTFLFACLIVIVSLVVYFGCEMILRKKVKVWDAYKGYLGFAAAFALFVSFFAFTSVFGFETYVPKTEDIESVAVFNYYYGDQEPFMSDQEMNKFATDIHLELVKRNNISVLSKDKGTRLHFVYKLKNGKTVNRTYNVTEEYTAKIMNKLYENNDYKHVCEGIFTNNIDSIVAIEINSADIAESADTLNELFKCIKEDTEKLSYDQLWHEADSSRYYIRYTIEESGYTEHKNITARINNNFVNTMEWLTNNGYAYVAAGITKGDSILAEIDDKTKCEAAFDDMITEITDAAERKLLAEILSGYYVGESSVKAWRIDSEFDLSVAISFGDMLLCPEINGAPVIQFGDRGYYKTLTDAEYEQFKEIVKKYKMTLPTY